MRDFVSAKCEVNGRPVARERGKSAAAWRTLALPPTVVTLLRTQRARVPIIADNLIAEGNMLPMIIVFPSGNATATPGDEKQGDRTQAAYGQPYHDDLLKEIIPFV